MGSNIKKAFAKVSDDRLYFQHLTLLFVFHQICDYHHLMVECRLSALNVVFGYFTIIPHFIIAMCSVFVVNFMK